MALSKSLETTPPPTINVFIWSIFEIEFLSCNGTIAEKSYSFVISFNGLEVDSITSKSQPSVSALTNIIFPAINLIGKQHNAFVFSPN